MKKRCVEALGPTPSGRIPSLFVCLHANIKHPRVPNVECPPMYKVCEKELFISEDGSVHYYEGIDL